MEGALAAVIDAAWAPVANTALLIILAVYQQHRNRQLQQEADRAQRDARDAKRAVGATRRHDTEEPPWLFEHRRWTDN